jgi:polyisoprenoid-binding protein YceI
MNIQTTRRPLSAFALVLALPAFGADVYQIDAVHSETSFRVRHLLSKVSGRFTRFTGTINIDQAKIANSSVDVTIEAPSITTENEARDKHLKSADFFEVDKFPTITFKSSSVKQVAKGKLQITGLFTMHGVSKVITIPMTNLGTSPGMKPGTFVAGFEGSLKVKRTDYGIKYGIPAVGDEVEITLNVEAGKVEPKA